MILSQLRLLITVNFLKTKPLELKFDVYVLIQYLLHRQIPHLQPGPLMPRDLLHAAFFLPQASVIDVAQAQFPAVHTTYLPHP
ncbi:unnamed protein product [Rhizophagus irregularis]|nr:unnamed protein product [Rhizophagus irregularis]